MPPLLDIGIGGKDTKVDRKLQGGRNIFSAFHLLIARQKQFNLCINNADMQTTQPK